MTSSHSQHGWVGSENRLLAFGLERLPPQPKQPRSTENPATQQNDRSDTPSGHEKSMQERKEERGRRERADSTRDKQSLGQLEREMDQVRAPERERKAKYEKWLSEVTKEFQIGGAKVELGQPEEMIRTPADQ